MQKIDLMMKYAPQPIENDQGQLVKFNFFKAVNDLLASFGDTKESDWWKPVPMAPPFSQSPAGNPAAPGVPELPPPPPGVTFVNQQKGGMMGGGGRPNQAPQRPSAPTPFNGMRNEQQMRKSQMNQPTRGV